MYPEQGYIVADEVKYLKLCIHVNNQVDNPLVKYLDKMHLQNKHYLLLQIPLEHFKNVLDFDMEKLVYRLDQYFLIPLQQVYHQYLYFQLVSLVVIVMILA